MTSNQLREAATGKASNPIANFQNVLERYKPQLALALPKHLNADRMARLAVTAFSTTPKLQQCSPLSIIGSIMTASQMGLEIGVNGQGFLVPYGQTCTFVPGWKGLTDLVSRTGRASVWTGAVFQGDEFDYALGDAPFVKHRPGEEDDPSKLTHVYAVGRVNGSQFPIIEVWSIAKVWKHRNKYNKVGDRHYSFRDQEMYARKVPLLQVLKYLPASVELSNALVVANAAEVGQRAEWNLNQDPIVMDLDPSGSGEVLNRDDVVAREQAAAAAAESASKAKEKPEAASKSTKASKKQETAAGPSYAVIAEKLKASKDADAAALVLDESRGLLPEDQLEELGALYRMTFTQN
jgi:recombination protein RecT